jgi:trehalose 6-phosphate synthase
MAPVLRDRGGLWIGWPGISEKVDFDTVLGGASLTTGYDLIPVEMDEEEVTNYYEGFSNQIIWPLFHDMQSHCTFDPEFWYSYIRVNTKFAERILKHTSDEDYIWVHDYHLFHVGKFLRERGRSHRIGFFLHIPFPPMDIFVRLPWRMEILEALMEYDLVGFQTFRDRKNFLDCLQRFYPAARVTGRGTVVQVALEDRVVRVGYFPISIDYRSFVEGTSSDGTVQWYESLKEKFRDYSVILGVDRMDFTKGLQERLEGYRNALERYPDLREKVTLTQVLVPSRHSLTSYQILKARIDRLIGEINGQFATLGWDPIHYHYRSLDHDELLALYHIADIALVTPLKDGMNLVAKEYCACSLQNNGVLILSEFAGAAAELHRGALLVNPHDFEGIADALYYAFTMDYDEKQSRMKKMRKIIRRRDIFRWVDSFLQAAFARNLNDFPPVKEEYVPGISGEDFASMLEE